MDRPQQTNSTLEFLRQLRQDTRQTRSLEGLRQNFEKLQELRRQSLDDFDLQVMIGDIHQEIVDRARSLRSDAPPPPPAPAHDDHSVIFQAKPAAPGPFDPMPPIPAAAPSPEKAAAPADAGDDKAPAAPIRKATQAVPSDAVEIPPEVTRIDPMSWKRTVWLAVFLCAIVLGVIFSLVQVARKANFPEENRAQTEKPVKPAPVTSAAPTVSLSPTLRLYTDLAAGTAMVDDGTPRSLVDGELLLDNLPAGQHSLKVSGSSGSASFQFEVAGKNAPKVTGVPQASNALLVLVSQQDGRGQLITSAGPSEILLDGKSAGQTSPAGLQLVDLGSSDHDLQLVHERDRQRFVMTYTPAPVLTVYVKSDPNTGIIQIVTGEDNVQVFVEDALFRRRTDHGQVRLSIRAGRYRIRVHKDGFTDPPMQWVDVKKGDVTQARFELAPSGLLAALQIRGAQPGTTAFIDHEFAGAVGADGAVKISNVKPGDHTIELRHDLAVAKRLQRTFRSGETLTLAGADVALDKAAADAGKAGSPVVVVPAASAADAAKTTTTPATNENQVVTHVQKGGGFISYGTPKSSGHYSFQTQGHVGGLLKKGKLQWYAGFKDNQNYVLFSLDGKHAEVREIRNGKSILWSRVSCPVDSSSWVQVDMAVKAGAISSRVKTAAEGWLDLGSVASMGRDFTQDTVGFYIPPNDEVAVANFKFANR